MKYFLSIDGPRENNLFFARETQCLLEYLGGTLFFRACMLLVRFVSEWYILYGDERFLVRFLWGHIARLQEKNIGWAREVDPLKKLRNIAL